MKLYSKQFKQILWIIFLVFSAVKVPAQAKMAKDSREYKNFIKIAARAGITFNMPDEFKEMPAGADNSAYDYGMNLQNQDFEIWFKINPAVGNAPDSLYLDISKNQAKFLAGDNSSLLRNVSGDVLADYNADAGKTYFINLPESAGPKHYKYALLIILEKNHRGSIMAVCLANDKGPDFFKNINKAGNCIKFKAGT